jgi:hypothetical protein
MAAVLLPDALPQTTPCVVRRMASKRADIHEAFLSLGCAWICWQSLRKYSMMAPVRRHAAASRTEIPQ